MRLRQGCHPLARGLARQRGPDALARVRGDPAFGKELLAEAVNAYLAGEEALGKTILRDVINATTGFEPLSAALGKPSKSLHRMLGPGGNPSTKNFFAILRAVQQKVGVRLKVRAA